MACEWFSWIPACTKKNCVTRDESLPSRRPRFLRSHEIVRQTRLCLRLCVQRHLSSFSPVSCSHCAPLPARPPYSRRDDSGLVVLRAIRARDWRSLEIPRAVETRGCDGAERTAGEGAECLARRSRAGGGTLPTQHRHPTPSSGSRPGAEQSLERKRKFGEQREVDGCLRGALLVSARPFSPSCFGFLA